ncbi:MAG: glycan-binding surface protein [Saprospiraceae bacterium]
MKSFLPIYLVGICLFLLGCEKDVPAPVVTAVSPIFGPAETLVTFEGENLGNLQSVSFSGQEVNFNTAYNSDIALLFRIPTNIPLGDHDVVFTTKGGQSTIQFRVTLDPPEVFRVSPESGAPGDLISIVGKNFFEPIEVYFADSVQAEIVHQSPDSLSVIVPENVEKGRITVTANGGDALSPKNFFTVNEIYVNDFDGRGLRAETNRWIFRGNINESPVNAVQSSNPDPLDGNFLKVSGKDDLDITWIGGVQSNFGFPGDEFSTFGIEVPARDVVLEMDLNSNGRRDTHIILILLEKDGSPNDFTQQVKVDWTGWQTVSIPLARFTDFNGVTIDPAKIKVVKIDLIDDDNTDETLEVNIDNIRFTEIF